jgi:hypothetical protein
MFILGLSMCDDWWPHSKAPRSEKPVAASSREAKDLMKLAQRRWFVAENWRRLRDGMEKTRTYIYMVGGLEQYFYVSIQLGIIILTDFYICQRG